MRAELARRQSGTIVVALEWDRETNEVRVCVSDRLSGDSFSLDVDASRALDAFYHPYAYAARQDSLEEAMVR